MSANTDAWMPFYVGDYLGDTQRLTTEQHGAYLLLILDYWRNGPPPDDDAVLAQITRLDPKAWSRHRGALSRLFVVGLSEWHHKRIDRELDAARENADRRSVKAKAAADARWGIAKNNADASPEHPRGNARSNATSNAPSNATSNAQAVPQAMLGECPPPSPSPEEEKDRPVPRSARDQKPRFSGQPAPVKRVLEEAGFVAVPNDTHLVGEWLALSDMQLERDVIPIVKRMAGQSMAQRGRPPFKLSFFDSAIREQWAADDAEIARLRAGRERLERIEREQAAERSAKQ